jgi:hypothetical protein
LWALSVCLFLLQDLYAQQPAFRSPAADTLVPPPSVQIDSLQRDSSLQLSASFSLSKDSLDAAVDYAAEDSMRIDVKGERIHLWGKAKVTYESITLEAGHIELNWATNMITAESVPDSLGKPSQLPLFKEGDKEFTANRMAYNFETRRGMIFDAVTQQNDVLVRSARSKFISGDPVDTTDYDIIYSEDAIFTTCTHEDPHFGIRSRKQKIIPDKLVVIGPSNLEVMGIPTPLWLPFGFFPVTKGRRSGLLFPRDYEYSPQWGFGLQNIGWFFPLGDHYNLSLTGNIYPFSGTWGVSANSNYRKRYKYNGNFTASFDSRAQEEIVSVIDPVTNQPVIGDNGQPAQQPKIIRNNGFLLRWTHNQDPSAHPTNRLGGSINFQTNNFQRRVLNDARSVQTNTINSNFSFSKNWTDRPYSFSLAFAHSQNTNSREMIVDFPTFQFQTQTLYPFRNAKRVGPATWYDNVNLRYTNEAKARFVGRDDAFFTTTTLDNAQYGVRHTASLATTLKVLKYFNLNPNVNYSEVWQFKTLERTFDPDPASIRIDTLIDAQGNELYDTLDYGTIRNTYSSGFAAFRSYTAGISLNTQIFGTLRFRQGYLRGLRHVIKPSVSLNYSPDYTRAGLNYYQVVADTTDVDRFLSYSRFDGGIYGTPPQSTQQLGVSYSLNNIFEAKIFGRKDTVARNVKLFDNLIVNGTYFFAADSLRWSQISARGAARFLKGATTLAMGATFDPYVVQRTAAGQLVRVNRFALQENGRLLRFVEANAVLSTNLTVGKIRAIFQNKEEEVVDQVDQESPDGQPLRERVEEIDFLSLFENFSIRHNLSAQYSDQGPGKRDTLRITANTLELRGSIQLTPNWQIDVGSIGYDFTSKRVTYPYLGFSRDIHCWEMGFNWAPVRNTYSFFLRVKPGTMDFLKIPYQRNNADGQNAFR